MSLAPLDLENTSGALNQPKAIYAGDAYQGQPYIVVTEDNIILVGDANTVINVGPDFGVLLSGKLSLSAMPDQISIGGGYWRLNPLLTSCGRSTGANTVVLTWCLASRPHKYPAHARWPADPATLSSAEPSGPHSATRPPPPRHVAPGTRALLPALDLTGHHRHRLTVLPGTGVQVQHLTARIWRRVPARRAVCNGSAGWISSGEGGVSEGRRNRGRRVLKIVETAVKTLCDVSGWRRLSPMGFKGSTGGYGPNVALISVLVIPR